MNLSVGSRHVQAEKDDTKYLDWVKLVALHTEVWQKEQADMAFSLQT